MGDTWDVLKASEASTETTAATAQTGTPQVTPQVTESFLSLRMDAVAPQPAEVSEKLDTSVSLGPIIMMQFLYMLSIGMTAPIYPEVMISTSHAAGDVGIGSTLFAGSMFVNAALEFVSAAFLGEMCDHFGRRPFLMLSSFGQALDYSIAGLAAADDDTPHEYIIEHGAYLIFAGRAIAGACGNLNIFTRASLGDISKAADSSLNFAKLGASIGAAMILGPGLGGLVFKVYGRLRAPMWFASSANFAILVMAWRMPEPLLRSNRTKKFAWRKANPLETVSYLFSKRFLFLFGGMSLLDSFALQLMISTMRNYCRKVFGFTIQNSASMMVVFGIGLMFSLACFLPLVVRRRGEIFAIKLGYVITTLGYIGFALVFYFDPHGRSMYLVMALFSVGMISSPTQLSVASRCVDAREQGKLQAANGSLDTLGKILGPLLSALVFAPSLKLGHPNVIWWLAAAIMVPGSAIAFCLGRFLLAEFAA